MLRWRGYEFRKYSWVTIACIKYYNIKKAPHKEVPITNLKSEIKILEKNYLNTE
jgi:hypothetical protein